MGESPAAVHALVDMELGSVILANMLAGWLDGNRESSFSVEAADEYHDQRATPEQERLCVCASVDAGASPPHQESTERQYALREKALALGWSEPAVQILDRDLGKSGAQIAGREDFKTLVAEVSMGQVGAVFALEVSRLSRSNLDWHRLLELCALTDTLVIDEDGCYNPAEFNDGLLLGLKGTMAQANFICCAGASSVASSIKPRKGSCVFPFRLGFVTTKKAALSWTLMKKCRGPWLWCFAFFARQVAPIAVMHQFAKKHVINQIISM